jgi:transcriptional regulator with XRE-family HTH domain
MSIKQRLKEFAKHKGISERSFCLSIGVSPTFISAMRKSMQPDKIESISHHYPELNITWLLTGDGQMINQNCEQNTPIKQIGYTALSSNEEIAMYKQLIESKDRLIDALERELKMQEKQLLIADREMQTLRDLIASYQKQLNIDEQLRKAQ